MKLLAVVLVSLGLLAGCQPSEQSKEGAAFRDFCMKGNNRANVPECSVFVGG